MLGNELRTQAEDESQRNENVKVDVQIYENEQDNK